MNKVHFFKKGNFSEKDKMMEEIEQLLRPIEFEEGQMLMKSETEMDGFYMIMRGNVSLWVPVGEPDISPIIH